MKRIFIIISVCLLSAHLYGQSADITLGLFFQPGVSYRIFSYQDRETEEAFQSLVSTEKPDIAWEGGITTHIYFSDIIHLESGINISKKSYRTIITTEDLVVRDENEDPVIGGLEKSKSNHEFYYVSVPVRIGTTIFQGRTYAAGVRAGVLVDYHFRSTVRYENFYHDRIENSVTHPEIEGFRQLNFSGSLSLFGSYKLSDEYDIMLEPYGSISLLPLVKDSDVNTRFLMFGIRFSLFHKF